MKCDVRLIWSDSMTGETYWRDCHIQYDGFEVARVVCGAMAGQGMEEGTRFVCEAWVHENDKSSSSPACFIVRERSVLGSGVLGFGVLFHGIAHRRFVKDHPVPGAFAV